jgi:hypothetical protein
MLIHSTKHDIRDQLVAEARAQGVLGAERLPASVHTVDLTDTLLTKLLDAHADGLAERAAKKMAP